MYSFDLSFTLITLTYLNESHFENKAKKEQMKIDFSDKKSREIDLMRLFSIKFTEISIFH